MTPGRAGEAWKEERVGVRGNPAAVSVAYIRGAVCGEAGPQPPRADALGRPLQKVER